MAYLDDLQAKYFTEIIDIRYLMQNSFDEVIIALAVDKANKAICKYCGWGIFDKEYTSALISLAIAYLNNDNVLYSMVNGEKQVKSITQGARAVSYDSSTVTFDNNGLTEQVKAMLPLPKIKIY